MILLAAALATLPLIAEKTAGLDRRDGLLPLYRDAGEGKLWLEIPEPGSELLYYTSLPAGIGSNDVGADRGQIGEGKVVRFDRIGNKVLLVQENLAYRADSPDPAERRAVEDAFATSVLWGFEVAAATGDRVLVDATAFATRDAHGVVDALARAKQGKYAVDTTRSAVEPSRSRAFPDNTEIEAIVTLTTQDDPGKLVASVTPSPRSVTVRERQSFVRPPPPGYVPRASDPGAGYFEVVYADYAAPLGAPLRKRLITRHRLAKRDPKAAKSEPVKPIVYYLDPGTPEPIRSALLDGARWWNAAFEKLGYVDAFRVEMLPDGADPMDVRYNTIQWVHRSTRGWSYGGAVVDPRTGEILKGNVLLGSLRVRQDYLIAEGLLSPYATGDEDPPELSAMALARLRQLAAHEVGHTLGLEHNFLASAEGRASVMDYPHPLARLAADGSIDLSQAYATGIGAWDEVAIAYGYGDFPEGTLEEGRKRGLFFIADQDARDPATAHPRASLWDNGKDATAELDRIMEVRRAALSRFGERAIRSGRPLATMEEALVPLYLGHRYQVIAAAKAIGGREFTYAERGDGQDSGSPVPAETQAKALDAILRTLRPGELAIPKGVLAKLPPRPPGFPATRELFSRRTGPTFDPVTPAEQAATIAVSALLAPERAARLVVQRDLDSAQPGLRYVLDRLVAATFPDVAPSDGYEAEIGRTVRVVVVEGIERLAADSPMPQVRAVARAKLEALAKEVAAKAPADDADAASRKALAAEIERFLSGKDLPPVLPEIADPPPGEPIGARGW